MDAPDLLPDLGHAVGRRTQGEGLEPGNDAAGPLHEMRAGHRPGMGVGVLEPETPGGVVGGVDHGKRRIHRIDERLPHLSDPHVRPGRGGDPEYIGGERHVQVRHPGSGVPKELPNGVRTGASIGPGEPGCRQLPGGPVREPNVVPLHFGKAQLHGLPCQGHVVVPHPRIPGIHPAVAPPVDPDATGGIADRRIRAPPGQDGILEDDNARHGVDARRLEPPEQPGQIGNPDVAVRSDLPGQGHPRGVAQVPRRILQVDDEGVHVVGRGPRQQIRDPARGSRGTGVGRGTAAARDTAVERAMAAERATAPASATASAQAPARRPPQASSP